MSIITKATLTKFQRVTFAEIIPSGNLIALVGKNAAGKTSFLDGLEAGMCGHDSKTIRRPIQDGAGKASIEIHLSDGSTLLRGYTPSGSTLKGKNAAGESFGQTEINRRLSALGIDGRKFIRLDDKKQLEALLSIVDLPFVPAELDAERKAIEAKRLLVGQQEKAIGDAEPDYSLPTEETSAQDIITSIRFAQDQAAKIKDAEQGLAFAQGRVTEIAAKIAELTSELEGWTEAAKLRQVELESQPLPADTAELESKLATVEEANAAIRANNAARDKASEKIELRLKYENFTRELKAIGDRKADGLAKAVMPITGLTFDDEGVLYQGVPFSRASGREQLIVSCAMIMATNPEIRVIVIRDGNVLDLDGMRILQEMAEATNFQVFIEFVAEDKGDHEHYFADGELAA